MSVGSIGDQVGLSFTSQGSTSFQVGTAGTFTITTIGVPAPALSFSGTLPAGVSFTDNGGGTATLAGTPAANSGGTYPLTLTAANGVHTATQTFTLTVNQAPAVTSAATATFSIGAPGTFAVTSTGFPRPTLTQSGALPAGVTWVDNGDGTGTLSGTPAAGTGGTHSFTLTATNGIGAPATQSFTLSVNGAGSFTSANNAAFTVGAAGAFSITTSSFPAATTIARGGVALPTGVTFTDNHDGTATLAGTPAAGTGGTYAITFTFNNGVAGNIVQNFTLTVLEPPLFTSANSTTFAPNAAGSFLVTLSGFPAPTVTVTGSLPSGVTFTPGTRLLAGTPTQTGSFPLVFTASNGVGSPVTQNFTLSVNGAPSITSANTAMFLLNTAGTFQVVMTGSPAPTVTVTTGVLPTGLTLSSAGLLSGTPTQSGSFPVTLTATNGTLPNATQNFTVVVNTPPAITSANAATFALNTAGTFQVVMTGFPAPTVSVTAGVLPNGVTLSPAGLLAGMPTQSGSFAVTLTATNGTLPDATQSFTVLVGAPPAITSANGATFVSNVPGTTFQVVMTGFPAPTVSVTAGVLPNGLTLSAAGLLSGTATQGGVFPVTLTATNGTVPNATQSFTVTVNQPPTFTSAAAATFVVGASNTFTVTTNGVPNATFVASGVLPSGVTFTDNGNGTATLAGPPAIGTNGTYPLDITATNAIGSAPQNFVLTVSSSSTPIITSAASATFTVGGIESFTVTTAAFPAVNVISEIGGLPSGVTFVNNNDGTATLSGRPNAGTAGIYPLIITASNGGPGANQPFTLTVDAAAGGAPTITSASTTSFVIGVSGTFTVTTTGTPAAAILQIGALPGGVTFTDNGDGTATLTGMPAAGSAGSYALTFTATNGVGTPASQNFTLMVANNVAATPLFTSAPSGTFTIGVSGNFDITTAATPAVTSITRVGVLPAGVGFLDNGDGTARLSGTPQALTAGEYPVTFVATGPGGTTTQSFTLKVQEAASVTSAASATFTTGTLGTFTVTTRGVPTPALTMTGTPVAGVTFVDNGNGTGTLSGTPAAGTGGTHSFTITTIDGVGTPGTQSFTLTVNDAGSFTSANNTSFTVGAAGTFSITTSSFPAATTITRTGALPTGVTFTSNGDGTATLAGTPAAGQGGTYPLTFSFNNGVAGPVTQNFTLTVQQPPLFTSANSTTFTVGTPGTFTLTASGVPAATITNTGGTPPAGVTYTSATRVLAGTATQTGPFALQFTATNGVPPDATQNFTLTVACPAITVNPSTLADGLFNTAYGPFTFSQTGSTGSSFTWSATGLPAGLSIAPTTGIVSGTPTTTVVGVRAASRSPSPTTSGARGRATRRLPSGRSPATIRSVTPSATRNWRSERWAPCRRRRWPWWAATSRPTTTVSALLALCRLSSQRPRRISVPSPKARPTGRSSTRRPRISPERATPSHTR